jgi:hypothetical protein
MSGGSRTKPSQNGPFAASPGSASPQEAGPEPEKREFFVVCDGCVKFFQKVVDRLKRSPYNAFIDGGAATDFAASGRFFVFLMKGLARPAYWSGGWSVF